jgi:hypothetical protein
VHRRVAGHFVKEAFELADAQRGDTIVDKDFRGDGGFAARANR